MPPSGECLHRIATVAAVVDNFGRKCKTLGDCRNSFFVFVSDRSRSGLAENICQIRFFLSCAVNKTRLFLLFLYSVWIP